MEELRPDEAERQAEATDRLLAQMRTGGLRGSGMQHASPLPSAVARRDWWDRPYEQLGGRTPTETLQDGDEDQVRRLIASWYADAAADRLRDDPKVVEMIRERTAALRRSA